MDSQADAVTAPPIPARVWKIAAVTGAAAFMAMLDSTVANLGLHAISNDFGATLSTVQWVATGYLIALAVSLPAAGWFGRRYGYGRAWAVTTVLFVGGSTLCALAPDPSSLIAARLLQGLAAGVMVPAGQAVIGATARPNQLGRIMGTLGLVIALGPAVGPALGGVLLELSSWRMLFWINVPVGVVALLAARGLVTRGNTDPDRPLDRRGVVLLGIGLPLFLYGAADIGTAGLAVPTLLALAAGVVMAVGFVLASTRRHQPLIDLRLLRGRRFAAATATAGLTGMNMYGGLLLLPLWLQLAVGQSSAQTGLMLLTMGLGSALTLPLAGSLTDRFGAGRVCTGGAGLLAVTMVPFLLPIPLPTTVLATLFVARGVGLALAQMPAMTAAYAAVTADLMGDATTLVNIVQRTGGAIGAVAVVTVVARLGSGQGVTGYTGAFALLALVAVATAATASMLRRAPLPAGSR